MDRQRRGRALDSRGDEPRVPQVIRDTAILAVRAGAELTLAEIAALDLTDYDLADGSLKVRTEGKTGRCLVIADACRVALDAWVKGRGVSGGPLFVPVLRSGQLVLSRRLTLQAVGLAARRGAAEGHSDPK
jgi:site-specific recombinase XerC